MFAHRKTVHTGTDIEIIGQFSDQWTTTCTVFQPISTLFGQTHAQIGSDMQSIRVIAPHRWSNEKMLVTTDAQSDATSKGILSMTQELFTVKAQESRTLTQGQLSELLGVSRSSVSRWISGKGELPKSILIILNLLKRGKVTVDDLRNLGRGMAPAKSATPARQKPATEPLRDIAAKKAEDELWEQRRRSMDEHGASPVFGAKK